MYEPEEVVVTGASSAVERVVAARVTVTLDPSGSTSTASSRRRPIDANGEVVTGVDVEPRTVHVQIPLSTTNKESRTLPVNPVVTGTPGAGFRIASIAVDPLVVTVEGDVDQLPALVSGRHRAGHDLRGDRDVTTEVALALPTGVVAIGTRRRRSPCASRR